MSLAHSVSVDPTLLDPSLHPPGGRVVARPDLWVSAHPLPLHHFNVVRRARRPPTGWAAVVAEVARMHTGPSRWDVASPDDALDDALAAAGYAPYCVAAPLACAPGEVDARPPPDVEVRRVDDPAGLATWYRAWSACRALATQPHAAPWGALLGGSTHLHVAWRRGEVVAAGALLVDAARGVGVLWGGGTVPGANGYGAYRALVAARVRDAEMLGLRFVATQARMDTTGPWLRRVGFAAAGTPLRLWERG